MTSVQMTVVAFFKNHQSTIKELLCIEISGRDNRAAFSDGFEGKSWYVLKINKETKVSFN